VGVYLGKAASQSLPIQDRFEGQDAVNRSRKYHERNGFRLFDKFLDHHRLLTGLWYRQPYFAGELGVGWRLK
jgi:hypothetical protein